MLFVCFTPKSVIKALTNCLVAEILTLYFFIKALDTLHSYIMHKHTKCKVKYFPPQIVGGPSSRGESSHCTSKGMLTAVSKSLLGL